MLTLLGSGCDRGSQGGPDPEVEGARVLGLASGSRLHRVVLGGRGSDEHVLPQLIHASPGDAVEFITVDNRVHTVSFLGDSLTAEAAGFLLSSGTLASPPLVSRGSRFVVFFEKAPLGRYPFESRGHGGVAVGTIELASPSDTVGSDS